MTRVTMQSINRHTQTVIHTRFAELAKLQQQMATGQRLTRPSDGAVDTANTLRLRTQMAQLTQYEANIWDGLAWAEITDTTMTSMNTIIQRARELAIQGDSDALSPTERRYICDEVEQLTRQVVALMNTRYKGDYIFSGTHTDKPAVLLVESNSAGIASNRMAYIEDTALAPLPPTTPPTTFRFMDPGGQPNPAAHTHARKIIPGSLEIKVAGETMRENFEYRVDYINGTIELIDADARYFPNLTDPDDPLSPPLPPHPMAQNFSPGASYNALDLRLSYMDESKDVYGANINTTGKILRQIEANITVNVNISIDDLAVNSQTDILTSLIRLGQGLLNANSEQINASIGLLDESLHKILSAQSTNGSILNRMMTTLERNEMQQLEIDRLRSNLEEADYGTVVTQFAVKQTVFNAALNSTSRIMQMSLMDYVR